MKTIELFTDQDLNKFTSNVGNFLEGGGLLDKSSLPKYSFNYDNVAAQVKLSEFINDISDDATKELNKYIEKKILDSNDRIVKLLYEIDTLNKRQVHRADLLKTINGVDNFKEAFKIIINK